jgi:hypothetical protein
MSRKYLTGIEAILLRTVRCFVNREFQPGDKVLLLTETENTYERWFDEDMQIPLVRKSDCGEYEKVTKVFLIPTIDDLFEEIEKRNWGCDFKSFISDEGVVKYKFMIWMPNNHVYHGESNDRLEAVNQALVVASSKG